MNPVVIPAGLTAASLLGHLAKETTMTIEETAHELSPEHAGFRAEHESMKAGILGLTITVSITTALMAYFVNKNNQEHEKLQEQLSNFFDYMRDFEDEVTGSKTIAPPSSSHRGLPVFAR